MEISNTSEPIKANGTTAMNQEVGSGFAEMLENNKAELKEGDVIKATVAKIDKDTVMLDIKSKAEIPLPISEFLNEEGKCTVNVGDVIDVEVVKYDPENDQIKLSYSKVLKRKILQRIEEAYKNKEIIKGFVKAKVKGGLSIFVGGENGVRVFMPNSLIGTRQTNEIDAMVGKTIEFIVDSIKQDGIIVSRKAYLERLKELEKRRVFESIKEGDVVEGIVKNITDYGVFVDLGGVDGLLHVTDISWGRIENPNNIFQTGQKITVKILNIDKEKQKISLGIKQLTEDPWLRVDEKYPIGSKAKGRVVGLTDYGAFVELEDGVEGLLHVSELSWTKRVRRASDVLKIGDEVEVAILNIDKEAKRISLGLKQLEGNPWIELKEKFPEGTVIESKVKNVTDFGVFVELGEGIDGLVRLQDLSWSKRIKSPKELYKKGDDITAVVLKVDVENQKVALGVKQLTPDPWTTATEKYQIGDVVSGKIVSITDFGLFVELEPGLEALLHESETGIEKGKSLQEVFKIDDTVTAKIISMNINSKKIGLSLKKMKEDLERTEVERYKKSQEPAANTLGSLIKQELMKKERENQ